ncbi:hypothetical protein FA15DRAFT_675940 [Coprinopsis marcescibilis]|uniref:A-kinase anchor protein 7-like phosphoesterase domain-containing protein n=1 Tax=Coprinopsis marcescibilis TaxID=230819 RepID=A0A5C3KC31_COPMA|nr:hypothetical protein FA15DRAFT_675940 [Coprinopsis marcescibilis]
MSAPNANNEPAADSAVQSQPTWTNPHRSHRPRGDSRGGVPRGGGHGTGRGTGILTSTLSQHINDAQSANSLRGRGRGRGGWRGRGGSERGRGRGGGGGGFRSDVARPTHFLALPLQTHSTLRTRIGNFQSALLQHSPPITGLDPSIVIDPRRLHLTLGVMALVHPGEEADAPSAEGREGLQPKKTTDDALALLRSLQPRISQLLLESGGGEGVKVLLEVLDVFPPGATTGANVLYLGPEMAGIDNLRHRSSNAISSSREDKRSWKERLWTVSNFVHQEFKKAGYIVEKRPLKLHCTILNASHRKPKRRLPFSYEDILNSSARATIEAIAQERVEPSTVAVSDDVSSQLAQVTEVLASTSISSPANRHPVDDRRGSPLSVDFGVYDVNDIQLWVMGSRGRNNEYVNLGGIKLEPVT